MNFIKEAKKNPNSRENRYNMDKIFEWDVTRNGETAWVAQTKEHPGTIQLVKKYLNKNSPLITKLAHEKHGGITQKVTIFSAKKAESGNTDAYIPVKMNDPRLADVTKYGGLMSVAVAGYTLVEYKVAGKTVRSLEALPIYLGGSKNLTEEQMVEYFSNVLQQENKKKVVSDVNIRKKMIPMGALIKYNGFYYYLGGKTNADMYIRDAVQVCFAPKDMEYIKKVDKAVSNNDYSEKDNGVGTTVLTKEKNVSLYKNICEKYALTIFKKKKGTIKTIVQKGKEVFEHDLTIEEQCIVLRNLMLNFQTGDSVDLHLIKGSAATGTMQLNKKVSNAEELKLIDQSVTGVFSREIDLLTI